LRKETSRNLYRVQALLRGKTETLIDREWKLAQSLKPLRSNMYVLGDSKVAFIDERRKSKRKEEVFHKYVSSLMGDSKVANDAVKLSLMGDYDLWQKKKWNQFVTKQMGNEA